MTNDDHHVFEAGRPMLVCGNTADMLQRTRFARRFTVTGDQSTHFGLFPCGPTPSARGPAASVGGACC